MVYNTSICEEIGYEMNKNKNIFAGISAYFKKIIVNYSKFDYAINYGLFGIILLLIKQTVTIISYPSAQIASSGEMYATFILIILLTICLSYIKIKKIGKDNNFVNIFITILPFIFVLIGLMIVHNYTEYNNRILSFVILNMILCWLQIYTHIRRVVLFVITPVSYIIINSVFYETNQYMYVDIASAIIISILAFLAATIIFQLHYSNNTVINSLDLKNKNFEKSIKRLKQTHESLRISKKITDTMYELTQEVLKNEKLEDVLQLVMDKAAVLIPNAQAGSILIKENDVMKFVAANGYDLNNLKAVELRYEETYQASLEDKFQPFIIKNLIVFDNAKIGEEKTKQLYNEDKNIAKSCMTCSFKYQGDFFGSINIDNFDSENVFNDNDMYLIKQLSQEIEIIISIHKLYEQALRPTKYDDLTQAKTRRYCITLLNEIIKKKQTNNLSICTIDINNLKDVNDKFGHDVGDRFLFEFAEAFRNSKIIDNIFGRVGGDEFLIIFKNLDKEGVEEQITVVKQYLKNNLFDTGNTKIEISFAHGIAFYGIDSKEISELFKLSDKRMYEDKHMQKIAKK